MNRQTKCNAHIRTLVAITAWVGLDGTATVARAADPAVPASTQSARAGAGVQEIVVTAERRSQNLQRTAASISVRTGTELQLQGKFTTAQILEDVPSVTIEGQYTSGTTVQDAPASAIGIRGVQARQVPATTAALMHAVATYTDGVLDGLGGTYDLDRVEVLRGPQGTLYGRSATAGVVNFYTADPKLDRFGGNAAVEFGNYGLQHYTAAVNVPVTDTVAVRVAGDQYLRNGYDASSGGRVNTTDARVKVLYKPSEEFSALLGYAYHTNQEHFGQNAGYLSGTGTGDVSFATAVPLGSGQDHAQQFWANLNWDLGGAKLTYIPAFRTFREHQLAYDVPAPDTEQTTTISVPNDTFHTEELRLTSSTGSPLSWQAGLFYYRNAQDYDAQAIAHTPLASIIGVGASPMRRVNTNVGLYAEGTYALTSSTRLTVGLRGDYSKVESSYSGCLGFVGALNCATFTPAEGTRDWRNLTYKARLEQDLSPTSLLYATVGSAFLPGDVAVMTSKLNAPQEISFDEEKLTAFEVGSKNRFLDNRLQVNGDFFYYRYGGQQMLVQIGNLFPGGPPIVQPMVTPSRMIGAELEVNYRPTVADRFGLNLSYVNGYFVDKSALFAIGVANTRMADVIPWILTPSYSHSFALANGQALTFNIEGIYHSGYLVTNLPQSYLGVSAYMRNGDVLQGNANLSWELGKYSISAYARNFTNQRYKTYINLQSSTDGTANEAVLSDPRTFGVVASARF